MTIADNLAHIQAQIKSALTQAKRPMDSVRLVAVSKGRSVQAIQAAEAAGQRDFGENYLQEALVKIAALQDLPITWHFIGDLQANKTRTVAQHFAWVHTLSRERIALRLNEQRPADLPPLNVCLQVNIDDEASKSGLTVEATPRFARFVAGLPHLRLRGLMVIPAVCDAEDEQRATFLRVKHLFDALCDQGLEMDTLSMGMSADFVPAILAGSTLVRVGKAIFAKDDA